MKLVRPSISAEEKLLTTKEAAAILHMNEETVGKKCAAGLIRCTKPGRRYLIPEAALSEYLSRHAVKMIVG